MLDPKVDQSLVEALKIAFEYAVQMAVEEIPAVLAGQVGRHVADLVFHREVLADTDHDMEAAVHIDFGWEGHHQEERWVDHHYYWLLMWPEMDLVELRPVEVRVVA